MADIKWVTTSGGKHIPLDEDKKKREIDFNKKEADKLNSSGEKLSLSKLDKLKNKKTKEKKK